MASNKAIKSALESMMFVWGEPLDCKSAADVFNMDKKEIYPLDRKKWNLPADRAGGVSVAFR